MPRSVMPPIILSEPEQAELDKLVRRPSTPQQLVLRARIILAAAHGHTQGAIARQLSITKDTVRLWRRRWLALQTSELSVVERLQDAARSGTPAKFSLEQITQLYAMACDPPEKYERPISHWSANDLAQEMVNQSIVESISPRHVARLLKEAQLKPHQTRYWLHPPRMPNLNSKSKTSVRSMS
ncbi:MAG: helix-turn-helix domain-containing protein [Cyanobacteria bacterium J06639_1]